MDWTGSVSGHLVVHVQKDACFGLILTLCTIFKSSSQFSENAIFFLENRKNFVSSKMSTFFYVFRSGHVVHQAVDMHKVNLLKI